MNNQRKYVVVINVGGGLWNKVIEVKREKTDFEYEWWSNKTYDLCWRVGKQPPNKLTCSYYVFDSKKEAQQFLDGAKAFREFIKQF